MVQQNRGPAKRGSQKWIQILVNEKPHILNSHIASELDLSEDDLLDWLSPLGAKGYAEYFDQACLDKLDVKLNKRPLKDFWPKNGTHWDALGKTTVSKKLLLVEARALSSHLELTGFSWRRALEKHKAESLRISLHAGNKRILGGNSSTDFNFLHSGF
ncbi:hypothetical protein MUO56_06745 [Candidatus Bathyarchaeota archaeon]|nr:hypothetical protein [Candidatus Bathyarchaeota archaeon]